MCIHLCVWNVMCVCTYVCKKCVYAYVCMFERRYVYTYVCMKCVCANAYMNCDEFVYIHRYEMWCVCTYACMKCDVSMCIHRYECDVCMYICMHELWWACVHIHVWNTVCVCTYISMKCDVCACVCVYKMWHMCQMWCVCKCLYEVWCLPHEGSNSESHCLCCTLFDFCQLWDQERACSHLNNGYNGKTETALNPSHEVEKQELVHTASGSVTRYNHFGEQPGSSKWAKHKFIKRPRNSSPILEKRALPPAGRFTRAWSRQPYYNIRKYRVEKPHNVCHQMTG